MRKLFLLFLITNFAFSQSTNLSLEEKIYVATEAFQANQNEASLKKLESFDKSVSKTIQVSKNKAELLAYIYLNCNKAFYQKQIGAYQDAIKNYEKAWQLYDKNKIKSDFDIIEYCLKPLGNLYTIIGDYDNAENTIKQYFYIADKSGNTDLKVSALVNLTNVLQNSGRIDLAISLLEDTLKNDNLTESQKAILASTLGANYLIKKETTKAKIQIEKAIKIYKKQSNNTLSLATCYKNLASIYFENKNYEMANSSFEIAENYLSKTPILGQIAMAKNYYDHALFYFNQQNYDKAISYITYTFKNTLYNYNDNDGHLPSKNKLFANTVLLDALDLQAAIYTQQNLPKKALECYQLCFYIEELFQSLLVYENSKIIHQIGNRNRTEKCIEIYYNLYQKEKKILYLEKAFQLSEITKSSVLKQFSSKLISKEEKLIRKQLQDWNTIIIKEQQKLNYADIDKINNAIKKQNELMLLLKSNETSNKNEIQTEINLNNLYSKLEKDKAVLVSYFAGIEKLYSFTIENNSIKLLKIDDAFKNNSVFYGFINYFKDSNTITENPKEYNHIGNTVFNLLKLPINKSNKNLIIIPDGILNFLPFEALITEQSTTTNFAKMHYLLNDFKVGYANSASFYLAEKPFQHTKKTVLGVFPVFENSNLELAYSVDEMKAIQRNFKGKFLSKSQATFDNFKLNAGNYSILHLSTHADSGDIESPAIIKFYDQDILYSEFYTLDINPDLVVLSACETGLGKLYKAEGAMSISRGFQMAGAKNLLFSLWKVNDYTTSVFMEKFYKNIKDGSSFFDANHKAKLDFLSDSDISNTKKSPYFWAPMVYYGTIESETSTNYLCWISIVGGLIGLFLLFKFVINGRFSKNIKEK
ncbi:CHAT domain-containing protein [Flavobacterium sp. SUN052]|uniref:CHAT domain-containing protein n=1 Tax=Flavobacterium sp. SUN052 TaxID=3002441 RepID=UPI00237D4F46|nr:CHAT domain-containing protein [Flavobacterium sp. SUN052]MEC4004099.1 CHAT domain-containing protein [Flavobacterium sp. SUN052]